MYYSGTHTTCTCSARNARFDRGCCPTVGPSIGLLNLLSPIVNLSLRVPFFHVNAITRPDSVAGLESGKAAIDAATIMAIRLGGACLEVLYANDGELLKQYCACSNALYNEVLGVSDSHRQIIITTALAPAHTHTHPHRIADGTALSCGWHTASRCVPFLVNHRAEL